MLEIGCKFVKAWCLRWKVWKKEKWKRHGLEKEQTQTREEADQETANKAEDKKQTSREYKKASKEEGAARRSKANSCNSGRQRTTIHAGRQGNKKQALRLQHIKPESKTENLKNP